MTIKALLPSPRYTGHDATESVLRNIRNLLTNCIFKTVKVREGVSKNLSFQIPNKKSAAEDFDCYAGPCVQLYFLLCTVNLLSYFQNG
jgi:hypothetical protein